jgi:hypothetical protein
VTTADPCAPRFASAACVSPPPPSEDAIALPFFSIFMTLWLILMLESWKRKEARLAMEWGTSGFFEASEEERPAFRGKPMNSITTGRPEVGRSGVSGRRIEGKETSRQDLAAAPQQQRSAAVVSPEVSPDEPRGRRDDPRLRWSRRRQSQPRGKRRSF